MGSNLLYSTFLGGSDEERGWGIAVDQNGNALVTGITYSKDFPNTTGAFNTSYNKDGDVFISKLNPSGSSLLYSTFIGGNIKDEGNDIAVDSIGNAFVTGYTSSYDFPVTPNANDTTFGLGGDAFVLKLNPQGSSLEYSTFIGGDNADKGKAITLDSNSLLHECKVSIISI